MIALARNTDGDMFAVFRDSSSGNVVLEVEEVIKLLAL